MRLWRKIARTEDPLRLQAFLDVVSAASWQTAPEDALDKTFVALNQLMHNEVLFYYAARKRHRILSMATRGVAILFGTAGVLVPLLAGADPDRFKHWSAYGYPLLAVATTMLLVNRLFGATGGHIRYVTAQLQLEQLMTIFRLDWAALAMTRPGGRDLVSAERALALLRKFALDAYQIIQDETNVWGKSVSEALEEYARYVTARQSAETPKHALLKEPPIPRPPSTK
jgi:hypothetical protein